MEGRATVRPLFIAGHEIRILSQVKIKINDIKSKLISWLVCPMPIFYACNLCNCVSTFKKGLLLRDIRL